MKASVAKCRASAFRRSSIGRRPEHRGKQSRNCKAQPQAMWHAVGLHTCRAGLHTCRAGLHTCRAGLRTCRTGLRCRAGLCSCCAGLRTCRAWLYVCRAVIGELVTKLRSPTAIKLDSVCWKVPGFSVSVRCRWKAVLDTGGAVMKLRSPTTIKSTRDWASTKINYLPGVPKLGSEVSKVGFTNFSLKLRSLTSAEDLCFSGLRQNRAESAKPS